MVLWAYLNNGSTHGIYVLKILARTLEGTLNPKPLKERRVSGLRQALESSLRLVVRALGFGL